MAKSRQRTTSPPAQPDSDRVPFRHPAPLAPLVESEAPTMPTQSEPDCENPDFSTLSDAVSSFFSSAASPEDIIALRDTALHEISQRAEATYREISSLAEDALTKSPCD